MAYEGNVEEAFDTTFQIVYESFGETKVHPLKPNGANIPLTNENRREYVDLYVKYLLEESIQKQVEAFLSGFKLLCDTKAFKVMILLKKKKKVELTHFSLLISCFELKNSSCSSVVVLTWILKD